MNISQEQREACALLEAEIRGGEYIVGFPEASVKYPPNARPVKHIRYADGSFDFPTPPDTAEGAMEWVRLLGMEVQREPAMSFRAWNSTAYVYINGKFKGKYTADWETNEHMRDPLQAIAQGVVAAAEAHAKKETAND